MKKRGHLALKGEGTGAENWNVHICNQGYRSKRTHKSWVNSINLALANHLCYPYTIYTILHTVSMRYSFLVAMIVFTSPAVQNVHNSLLIAVMELVGAV